MTVPELRQSVTISCSSKWWDDHNGNTEARKWLIKGKPGLTCDSRGITMKSKTGHGLNSFSHLKIGIKSEIGCNLSRKKGEPSGLPNAGAPAEPSSKRFLRNALPPA